MPPFRVALPTNGDAASLRSFFQPCCVELCASLTLTRHEVPSSRARTCNMFLLRLAYLPQCLQARACSRPQKSVRRCLHKISTINEKPHAVGRVHTLSRL